MYVYVKNINKHFAYLYMMRARYVNVSIPEDLAKKIDDYTKKSGEGYHSRAELVIEAIRLRLGILKKK